MEIPDIAGSSSELVDFVFVLGIKSTLQSEYILICSLISYSNQKIPIITSQLSHLFQVVIHFTKYYATSLKCTHYNYNQLVSTPGDPPKCYSLSVVLANHIDYSIVSYKLGYHILVLPNQVLHINSVLTNKVLLYMYYTVETG